VQKLLSLISKHFCSSCKRFCICVRDRFDGVYYLYAASHTVCIRAMIAYLRVETLICLLVLGKQHMGEEL
jgi:hypothetical protein